MSIQRSFKKALSLFAIIFLFLGMNQHVLTTAAYFSDIEESFNNKFNSSSLDLEIENTVTPYDPIIAGEAVSFDTTFKNVGALDFNYDQRYQYLSGDEGFCQQLYLIVKDGATSIYQGLLKDYLLVFPQLLTLGSNNTYSYEVKIPDDAEDIYINMSCTFDLSSYAWQSELTLPLVGFWDEENFSVTVVSGVWQSCREDRETWANSIDSVLQGTRKDGSGILVEKSNPDSTLFKPDGTVFSLGVGGMVAVELKYPARNKSGVDLAIYEATEDRETAPLERAKVEVSHDNSHWYFVGDVTSRNGGDGIGKVDFSSTGLPWVKYIRLTDVTDYTDHDGSADGYDIDAVSGLYSICEDSEQIACKVISGAKKNTATSQGLKDWEIVVHPALQEPKQTLEIAANNPNPADTVTLENNRKYLIEASGIWIDGANRAVDANFFSDDNWTNHGDYDTEIGRDVRQLDIVVNDGDIEWGTYNEAHLYKKVIVGDGNPLAIRIFDGDQDPTPPSWHQDNNGSLTVRIYDVTDQIARTNDNGEYAKEVCGTNYQIIEVSQDGWVQESPVNPSYYHIDLRTMADTDKFDFGNKSQIVLNEIMYNPSDSNDNGQMPGGEWVEIYNLSNKDIDLVGWEVRDDDGDKMVVGTNNSDNNQNTGDGGETVIPAKGFLVVYRNGGSMFANGGDYVGLFDNNGVLRDEHIYGGGKGDNLTEARIPDGTGAWIDPIATPGRSNIITETLEEKLVQLPVPDGEEIHNQNTVGNEIVNEKEVNIDATPEENEIITEPTPTPTPVENSSLETEGSDVEISEENNQTPGAESPESAVEPQTEEPIIKEENLNEQ